MSELTPETLRELPDAFDVPAVADDYIRAHADAWEAGEKLDHAIADYWQGACAARDDEIADLRKRLEAAERMLARAATMLRGVPQSQRHILGIGGTGMTHWYESELWVADYDAALAGEEKP